MTRTGAGQEPDKREIHPDATAFRVMTEDELAELAADIKANGLIHPIVVDADGVLVDGRNRMRACEIAGVKPTFAALNGRDAKSFIVSANLQRRDLTKGQKAIALAMLYPEPEKGGRGKKNPSNLEGYTSRLSEARSILRYSQGLAEDVRDGRKPFDVALRDTENARQRSASVEAQMAELREKAPDVAALVDDERLTLEAGITEVREREQKIARFIAAAEAAVDWLNELPARVDAIEDGLAADPDAPWLDELQLEDIAEGLAKVANLRRARRKRR